MRPTSSAKQHVEHRPRAAAMGAPATGSPHMTGAALGAGIFVLSLATFIVILDTTIINVAVPHIAGAFAASANEGTWTITSYAAAEAFTIPLSGWLDRKST